MYIINSMKQNQSPNALQNLISKVMLRPMAVVDSCHFEPHLAIKSDVFQGNHQNWKDAYH